MTELSTAGLTLNTLTQSLGAHHSLETVAAAATLAAAASAVQITADGNRIVLNFTDLGAALELWKPWGSAAKRSDFMHRFQTMLLRLNVVIEFRVAGRLLGGFGPGTQPSLLHRLLA